MLNIVDIGDTNNELAVMLKSVTEQPIVSTHGMDTEPTKPSIDAAVAEALPWMNAVYEDELAAYNTSMKEYAVRCDGRTQNVVRGLGY